MTRSLRLIAVGGEPEPAAGALSAATGLPVEVVGTLASLRALLSVGPDLALDAVAWWSRDPAVELDDLRSLTRMRPRLAVLAIARQAEAVGPAELACEGLRERGEVGAVAVAAPDRAALRTAAVRLAVQQGWPLSSGAQPASAGHAAALGQRGPAAEPAGAHPGGGRPEDGAVVTVFGPKGGSGKTTVAILLAAAAGGAAPGTCAFVDLDLETPDATALLQADAGPDLVDLLPSLAGDEPVPELRLSPWPRGGFDVLPGPARPELAALVRPEHVQRLLARLRARYRLTVVDTCGRLGDDATCAALEAADRILLVVTPEPTSVRRAAVALDLLGRIGWRSAERLAVAVNGVDGGSLLTRGRVEALLGLPVVAWIPWDRDALRRSALAGAPLVSAEPAHPIAAELMRLASALGIPAPAGARAGRWRALAASIASALRR